MKKLIFLLLMTIPALKVCAARRFDIATVATIAALQAYNGPADTVLVTDTKRGGEFTYTAASMIPDSGTIFRSARGGYYVRIYVHADGILVDWFPNVDNTGTTDSYAGLQFIYDHFSGKINYGNGTYFENNDPVIWQSHTYVTVPGNTVIHNYNTDTVTVNSFEHLCLKVGKQNKVNIIENGTYYHINATSAAQKMVTLSAPSDVSHFSGGDAIWIEQGNDPGSAPGNHIPAAYEINRVDSVKASTGTIYLRYNTHWAYKDTTAAFPLQIARFTSDSITYDVSISGGHWSNKVTFPVLSEGHAIWHVGGGWGVTIKNAIIDTSFNSFAGIITKDLTIANVTQTTPAGNTGITLGRGMQDFSISNYWCAGTKSNIRNDILMNENSYNGSLSNSFLYGSKRYGVYLTGCSSITLNRNYFSGNQISVFIAATGHKITVNNTISAASSGSGISTSGTDVQINGGHIYNVATGGSGFGIFVGTAGLNTRISNLQLGDVNFSPAHDIVKNSGKNTTIFNVWSDGALTGLLTLSYPGPQSFTVNSPISTITPASSGVAAAAYNDTLVNFAAGFGKPRGIAVDTAGNVYVADFGNNVVKKIPANGSFPVCIGSGFNGPAGVAVDRAGNVYVADYNNMAVKKIPAGGGAPVTIGSGFSNPYGVAADTAGNVYVADYNNHAVKKIPVGGGAVVSIGSGFANPAGVAVDAAGNVYVADYGNSTVKKIPAGGGAPVAVGSGFSHPYGVAVDASGNIFIADYSNHAIKEVPAAGGSPVSLNNTFSAVYGVAADRAGNVLAADYNNTVVSEIAPVGGYYISSALPKGLVFSNSTGQISGTPTSSAPATNYTITAYNSQGSGAAAVNITVNYNKDLSNLQPGGGSLSPAFSAAITSYAVAVGNSTTSITITPTVADALAKVAVNGTPVRSGTASHGITLSVGNNTISVVVTAPDNTTKTYTVTVTRAPSSNANLSALKPGNGTLSPAFSASTTSYAVAVPNSVLSTTVTPTTAVNTATVTVNGVTVASGTASGSIPLTVGQNPITVVVTAQDNSTKTYTVTVTRAPSSNANLSALKPGNGALTPAFSASTTSYAVAVANSVVSTTIAPTTAVNTATVTVNGVTVASGTASGSIPLTVGENPITVVVTAQDNSTQTYTVTVTRAASGNANLSSLKSGNGSLSPTFSAATTSYTVSVANSVTSTTITPKTADNTATVTVNGTLVTSGTASGSIALAVGPNTVTVVVTAQNSTTKTYTVTITRASGSPVSHYSDVSFVVSEVNDVQLADDGVEPAKGLSPNGDGINDILVIKGITAYPDNKLTIINRDGVVVYEVSGYNNASRAFDGHSNKTGIMQHPGTYFYLLEYRTGNLNIRKTGFIVLKY